MARDAELKLTLNTEQAIKEAQRFSKDLKAAMNIKGGSPAIENLQTKLNKALTDAEALSKNGKNFVGAFNSKNLDNYNAKLENAVNYAHQLDEVYTRLKKLGLEDVSRASAQGKLGAASASKDKTKIEEARTNFELIKQRDELENKLVAEMGTVEQYAKKVETITAFEREHKQEVIDIHTQYNDLVAKTSEQAENQDEADQSAQRLAADAEKTAQAERDAAEAAKQYSNEKATQEKSAPVDTSQAEGGTEKVTESIQETDNSLRGLIKTVAEYNEQLKTMDQSSEEAKDVAQQLAQSSQELMNRLAFDPSKASFGELATQLNEFKQAQSSMASDGTAASMSYTYQRVSEKIEQMSTLIREYKQSMRGIPVETETVAQSTNKAKNATADYGKIAADAAKTIKKSFSFVNGLVGTIRKGFNNLAKTTTKVKSSFDGMARSMRSNFKHMITSITKYVLGFRSLFFLVRRLRKYIGEGIQNMAQFNEGNNHVNESITRLLSSLLFLKNAWATAFSPILQVVTPILEALIDKIAAVGNAFSRFLGSLFGVSQVFQAVKVDAADYAKGLDKAGGSAGRAADKTKKLTDRLAAFDDLNVLGVDRDPDGTKSGGGGGGADAYTPDPNEMFKLVDVGSEIKDKFLEMWNNADFTELGDIVEDKIATALGNIKWDEIQTTAYNIGKSIITFLNGALADPTLWESAGSTFAEIGNTITQFLSGIFDNNEIDVGGGLATLINSFFTDFDWETLNSLIEQFGVELKDNINSLFANLDLFGEEGILSDVEGSTASLTTAIVTLITGIDYSQIWDAAVGIADAILGGIQEGLQSSDNPIMQSLGDVIGSISEALNILAPLIEPVLLLVAEFAEQLLPIISDNLPQLAEWISNMATAVLPVLFDLLNLLMPILSEIVTMIFPILQTVLEAISPLLEVISTQVLPVVNELLTELMPLINAIIGVIAVVTTGVAKAGSALISLMMGALNPLMPILQILIEHFTTWFNAISAILKPVFDLLPIIINLISLGLNPLFNIIGLVATVIKDTFGEAFKYIVGIIQSKVIVIIGVLKTVLTGFTLYFSYVGGILKQIIDGLAEDWNSLVSVFKSVANSIIGVIESMVNNVINGLNGLLSGLDDIADVASSAGISVPTITKIPTVSLPRLAQGAVIPPNKEFMAVLGDQSHGTNIEAPLDTIKQAVAEVMGTNAGNQEVIQLLQQLITVVENKNLTIGDKEIGKANARYTNQQRMIRGTSF